MKRIRLSLIILIILCPLTIFCYQDSLDVRKPSFLTKDNESDINYILENAPDSLAFSRTKALAKPMIESGLSKTPRTSKDFIKAVEVFIWAKNVFSEKDANYDSYFDKMIEILSRKDAPLLNTRLSSVINSKKDEYWPNPVFNFSKLGEKELYFTRYNRTEDIYVSDFDNKKSMWSKPRPINSINTNHLNEAVFSISDNGRIMVIYQEAKINSDQTDLYLSYRGGSKWSKPVVLPPPINGPNDYEGGGVMTKDERFFIFSSDRRGGQGPYVPKRGEKWGNQDLYVSEFKDGVPINLKNLGPVINTPGAELTPFFSLDGLTLYFSSNGHPGLGGTDVFKSTRSNRFKWDQWSEPINLGVQVNSSKNDEGYKINPKKGIAYFDSKKTYGNKDRDIFKIGFKPEDQDDNNLIEIKVIGPNNEPIVNVETCLENPLTGEKIDCSRTDSTGTSILDPPNNSKQDQIDSGPENNQPLIVTTDSTVYPVTEEITQNRSFEKLPQLSTSMIQQMSPDIPVTDDKLKLLKEQIDAFKKEFPDSISLDPNSVKLIWPLESSDSSQYAYDAVSVYMDHDPRPGKLQDYNCGQQTYEIPGKGYNHQGTDIFLWPFAWDMMDREIIQVVSAADGYIIDVIDGNFDRNCTIGSPAVANTVVVIHKDGSFAIYAHLKKGSVTKKTYGDPIKQGETIGLVGSSGQSTGPHLHFELYDSKEKLTDPFGGNCSDISWWEEQRPYHNTQVNHLLTHLEDPLVAECSEPELIYDQTNFFQGDSFLTASYYQDIEANNNSNHVIITPSGETFSKWEESVDEFFVTYPGFKSHTLPSDAEPGKWEYNVALNQNLFSHTFWVNEGERERYGIPDPLKNEKIVLKTFDPKIDQFFQTYFCSNQNVVYFDFDKSNLNKRSSFVLERIASFILREKYQNINITGHTDSIGNKKYNRGLAEERAWTVGEYLEDFGIKGVRIFSRGEEELIIDERGREIMEKSRRVEICIKKF